LFNDENITVYPVPASDKITISINDHSYSAISIRCFDVLGNEVFETSTYNKLMQIDVSSFSKGIYFIQLQTNDAKTLKSVTKKIIVQ